MKNIVVLFYNSTDNFIYRDLLNSPKVEPYFVMNPLKNNILNFLRRIHTSVKLRMLVKLPFKYYWYKSLISKIEKNSCLIFSTLSLVRMDVNVLKKIKNNPNSPKMVLIILDSIHAHSPHLQFVKDEIFNFDWDLIFSFDKNDCRKFEFEFLGETYYSMLSLNDPVETTSDIYFIGANKGEREQTIMSVYKKLHENGVKCNFNIIDAKKENVDGINYYKKWLPYSTVLQRTVSANCILEVLQKGQKSQSIRYFEAVCYNKKLLTNNPNIRDLSFYDSRYMKYFESINDIDPMWVQRRETIDYHYNGEFSPLHILDKINNYFNN